LIQSIETDVKRKLIDIDPETFKKLSVNAAADGVTLKAYIESRLKEIADKK
jgi:predicted HicB family RNase H-like nuclease